METAERVFVPLIALAELKAGFAAGSRRDENEGKLTAFLAQDGVELVLPGRNTSDHYAQLFRQLRRAGTPIPTNDLWIASLAVEHGLRLYTRDAHYRYLRRCS